MLKEHIEKNDELLEGFQFIVKHGNIDEFNRSQKYFNRRPIVE